MHGWLIESEDGWTLLRPEFPVCEAMVDELASVREHLLASNLIALGVPAEISLRLEEMGVGSLRELLAAPERPARTVALGSALGRPYVPVE
jgi:hypothetical protein